MLSVLPGNLFLGVLGVLFTIAIISGVVLYRPFMTQLPFGMVRRDRSRRRKWLDLHNLLVIVTAGWLLVVGFTGVINTPGAPLYPSRNNGDSAILAASYAGQPNTNTFDS